MATMLSSTLLRLALVTIDQESLLASLDMFVNYLSTSLQGTLVHATSLFDFGRKLGYPIIL